MPQLTDDEVIALFGKLKKSRVLQLFVGLTDSSGFKAECHKSLAKDRA
jgi:hypothetical protein